MILRDTDPMPWGKYKGQRMQDVPAAYLFWLWTERGMERDQVDIVACYIRRNLVTLALEYPEGVWEKGQS